MTRAKWLLYAVVLGASPILTRGLVAFLVETRGAMPWVVEADLLAFGLLLAIMNINLLEHERAVDAGWKTRHIALSLLNVIFLVAAFVVSCVKEADAVIVASSKLLAVAIVLALSALVHSYAVSDRLEKTGAVPGGDSRA